MRQFERSAQRAVSFVRRSRQKRWDGCEKNRQGQSEKQERGVGMKKLKRVLTVWMLVLLVSVSVPFSAFAMTTASAEAGTLTTAAVKKGWKKDKKGYWHYYNSKGKQLVGFKKISGKYYYFDKYGRRRSGFKTIKKKKRYFSPKDGTMQTGFITVKGKTYYCNKSGVVQTGWKIIGEPYYYFNSAGVMTTGLRKIGGCYYYFLEDGRMANIGLYKNYIIGLNGVCHEMPKSGGGSKKDQARRYAKLIAECVGKKMGSYKLTDLDRVSRAAIYVSSFSKRCKYTMSGKDYSTAYGVFIKKEYSCAGSTRALGMVLDCMGYKWKHVNENKYSHQWCRLKMDGKTGYADGQVGWAGYGKHPVE